MVQQQWSSRLDQRANLFCPFIVPALNSHQHGIAAFGFEKKLPLLDGMSVDFPAVFGKVGGNAYRRANCIR